MSGKAEHRIRNPFARFHVSESAVLLSDTGWLRCSRFCYAILVSAIFLSTPKAFQKPKVPSPRQFKVTQEGGTVGFRAGALPHESPYRPQRPCRPSDPCPWDAPAVRRKWFSWPLLL